MEDGAHGRGPALLAVLLLAAGCGAPTAADVVIVRADKLEADQVQIAGSVDGEPVRMTTVPESARMLRASEDVRILLPESYGGKVLRLTATALRGGAPVGVPQQAEGELASGSTKRIDVCFDPDASACP